MWEKDRTQRAFLLISLQYEQPEVKLLSRVQLFATPWTVAYQAPPSMGFSRQEYWSGLPFPEDLIKSLNLNSIGVEIRPEILHFQQAHR